MRVSQIQDIAREMGIRSEKKLKKVELVHAIQREEGNFDCFATAYDGVCDQMACIWRDDCFKIARKGLAS